MSTAGENAILKIISFTSFKEFMYQEGNYITYSYCLLSSSVNRVCIFFFFEVGGGGGGEGRVGGLEGKGEANLNCEHVCHCRKNSRVEGPGKWCPEEYWNFHGL
jgi:hypothetical protein